MLFTASYADFAPLRKEGALRQPFRAGDPLSQDLPTNCPWTPSLPDHLHLFAGN